MPKKRDIISSRELKGFVPPPKTVPEAYAKCLEASFRQSSVFLTAVAPERPPAREENVIRHTSEQVDRINSLYANGGLVSSRSLMAAMGMDVEAEYRRMEYEEVLASWESVFGQATRSYEVQNSGHPGCVPILRVMSGNAIHELLSRLTDISERVNQVERDHRMTSMINDHHNHFSFQVNSPRRSGKTLAVAEMAVSGVPMLIVVPNRSHAANMESMINRVSHSRSVDPQAVFMNCTISMCDRLVSDPGRMVAQIRSRVSRGGNSLVCFDEVGPRNIRYEIMRDIVTSINENGRRLVPFVFLGTSLPSFVSDARFRFGNHEDGGYPPRYHGESRMMEPIRPILVDGSSGDVTVNLPHPSDVGEVVVVTRTDGEATSVFVEGHATERVSLGRYETITLVHAEEGEGWTII